MRRFLKSIFLLNAGIFAIGCGGGTPTYYKDVKPIVQRKCVGCHTEGGIAPFGLTTYEDLYSRASLVQSTVVSRTMPPWMPAADCAEYKDDFSLSDDEIDTISNWAKKGAEEGDPADDQKIEEEPSGISRVDQTLSMSESYTPQLSPDDYRCFQLAWPEAETKYVTGVEVIPGQPSVVHHVIAYLVPPGSETELATLEAEDALPGYTCFGGPRVGDTPNWIGTWVPGSRPGDLPVGLGIKVEPGSTIVMQVHYNTLNAEGLEDLTSIDLKLDAQVEKEALILPFLDPFWTFGTSMEIPAGDSDVMHSFSFDPSAYLSSVSDGVLQDSTPVTIYSAGLHMHLRGKSAKLEIERVGGDTECLLNIPAWDFHWQSAYEFSEPKVWQVGDKLSIECHWDNGDGDADLYWGEGTTDEMCLGAFLVAQ